MRRMRNFLMMFGSVTDPIFLIRLLQFKWYNVPGSSSTPTPYPTSSSRSKLIWKHPCFGVGHLAILKPRWQISRVQKCFKVRGGPCWHQLIENIVILGIIIIGYLISDHQNNVRMEVAKKEKTNNHKGVAPFYWFVFLPFSKSNVI